MSILENEYLVFDASTKTLVFKNKEPHIVSSMVPMSIVTDVEKIVIPEGVQTIGCNAFSFFVSLHTVVLSDTVERIRSKAFFNCGNLKNIKIGNMLNVVEERSFSGCRNLENIYIKRLDTWCNINFWSHTANPLFCGGDLYLNNTLIKDLVIPDNLHKISPYAFNGCRSIENVTIPKNIKEIGKGAFAYCDNLKKVKINNGVERVDHQSFYRCDNLKYINFPESITDIVNDAIPVKENNIVVKFAETEYLNCWARANNITNNTAKIDSFLKSISDSALNVDL